MHALREGGAHACFWGGACQGLEGCTSLEAFFRRANGEDAPPDGGDAEHRDADLRAACARSQAAPHGPVLAHVAGLNALEVGLACIGVGAGRQQMGEALSLGAGLLLHKKLGEPLRQGDVLFTLFAAVGGEAKVANGTRRVIDVAAVDAACARIFGAYEFGEGAPPAKGAHGSHQHLVRAFIDRDGSVHRV